ncbi:MAG: ABC transporter permease subunit, partial [Clostridia bacterium]|nr:ABC transporter permease subunit [Clostridia bacterium]
MERNISIPKPLKTILITLFWLGIWEVISLMIGNQLLFPSPVEVTKKLVSLVITISFWETTLFSLSRVGFGIIIAIILGIIMGIICSLSKIIYDIFSPFVTIIKSTPVASFIILFIVLIKNGNEITPIIITALMVFPIVFSNIYKGIDSLDKNLLEVCNVYKIPFNKKLSILYIPSIMPYFSSALLSSIGLGWKAGIAAEVLSTPKTSIGIELFNGKQYLEYVDVFAWTVTVIIISLIF